MLSILPIDAVEPTPFQRDLSDAPHKHLADVINKTGRFLDPIIAVIAPGGKLWTPNGRRRLEAMRRLGAKSITALVVPDFKVAWQILALNTEKAHNLKERSLELIRIYRGLVEEDAGRPESEFRFYLEEAAFVTLGICYERVPRFGGGVYHPILRRLETFTEEPLRTALKQHEKRAGMVLDLDEKVATTVQKLKAWAGQSIFAHVCGDANQPTALDEGGTVARRPAQDLAGAGSPIQHGKDQAARPRRRRRAAGRGRIADQAGTFN